MSDNSSTVEQDELDVFEVAGHWYVARPGAKHVGKEIRRVKRRILLAWIPVVLAPAAAFLVTGWATLAALVAWAVFGLRLWSTYQRATSIPGAQNLAALIELDTREKTTDTIDAMSVAGSVPSAHVSLFNAAACANQALWHWAEDRRSLERKALTLLDDALNVAADAARRP